MRKSVTSRLVWNLKGQKEKVTLPAPIWRKKADPGVEPGMSDVVALYIGMRSGRCFVESVGTLLGGGIGNEVMEVTVAQLLAVCQKYHVAIPWGYDPVLRKARIGGREFRELRKRQREIVKNSMQQTF